MNIRALRYRRGGFTLVEIMVVVIVIGILAATIIPKFTGVTHDAKVATAKGNIAELDAALERYNVQMDAYPSNEEGLKALVEKPANDDGKWRGPYIKLLRSDPWGHPYNYKYPGTHHATGPDLWATDPKPNEAESAEIGNWQENASQPK
jgi:general secretion pathway protein G